MTRPNHYWPHPKFVIPTTTTLCVTMMVEIVVHLWYLMKCALWAMIADATLLERCIEALKQVISYIHTLIYLTQI